MVCAIHVARTLNNLGGVYFDLGDFTNAKLKIERGLKICEKIYEPDMLKLLELPVNLAKYSCI